MVNRKRRKQRQPAAPAAAAAPNESAAADSTPPAASPAAAAAASPAVVQAPALVVDDSADIAASDPAPVPLVAVEGMLEDVVMLPDEPLNDLVQPTQQASQQNATTSVSTPAAATTTTTTTTYTATNTIKAKTPPPSPKRQAHFQPPQEQELPQQPQNKLQKQELKKPQDLQPDRPISLALRQRMMSMNSTHSLFMDAMEDYSSDDHHHQHHYHDHKPKHHHAHNVSDLAFTEAVVSESSAAAAVVSAVTAAPGLVAPLSPTLEKEEHIAKVVVKPVMASPPTMSLPPLRGGPPPPPTVTVPLHSMQPQQQQPQPQQQHLSADSRIRLGICAMDKKARSRPMTQILSRLDDLSFEVVFFGDDLILNHDITEWPICDVVIAFFSKGYPLAKAKEYVALRKPFILNDLEKQELLQDRRKVYDLLEASGIDVPRHVYLSRDGYKSTGTGDGNGAGDTEVQEFDDHVIVNGLQIHKRK
jgi:Diphosphoinositol pentakisphosphate kinase 2 N-terminal domain